MSGTATDNKNDTYKYMLSTFAFKRKKMLYFNIFIHQSMILLSQIPSLPVPLK